MPLGKESVRRDLHCGVTDRFVSNRGYSAGLFFFTSITSPA